MFVPGCVQEAAVRFVFLPRPDAGEEEVRPVRLEHPVRVQRDGPAHLRAAAEHVPGAVPGPTLILLSRRLWF